MASTSPSNNHRTRAALTGSRRRRAPNMQMAPRDPPDEVLKEGLANLFARETRRNDKKAKFPEARDSWSVYFSVRKPNIPNKFFADRLVKYVPCSGSCFIVCQIYLQRLSQMNKIFRLTSYNIHRLMLTSLLLAAKMLDDRVFSNLHYSRVGGINTVKEMNVLEMEMLKMLDFRLNVSPEEYYSKRSELLRLATPPGPPRPITLPLGLRPPVSASSSKVAHEASISPVTPPAADEHRRVYSGSSHRRGTPIESNGDAEFKKSGRRDRGKERHSPTGGNSSLV